MSETMTVEGALIELRAMFPKGHLRAESSAQRIDRNDDPDGESSSFAMIVISRATKSSAKSFRGATLADCVDQARKWKASQ